MAWLYDLYIFLKRTRLAPRHHMSKTIKLSIYTHFLNKKRENNEYSCETILIFPKKFRKKLSIVAQLYYFLKLNML